LEYPTILLPQAADDEYCMAIVVGRCYPAIQLLDNDTLMHRKSISELHGFSSTPSALSVFHSGLEMEGKGLSMPELV
jgi:hypothetical protein